MSIDKNLLPRSISKRSCLGIEPAENCAEVAMQRHPSICRFFGVQTAKDLVADGERADLLIGNNVLAHVPDLNDFVGGIKVLLAEKGTNTMEFPHLVATMEGNQFDSMYQEHYCYISFHTIERVFAAHGLTLFDVEEIPTHGGSLPFYARHAEDTTRPVSEQFRAAPANGNWRWVTVTWVYTMPLPKKSSRQSTSFSSC